MLDFLSDFYYYGIENAILSERMREAAERIEKDASLGEGMELAARRLFTRDGKELNTLWKYKTVESLFGREMPDYATDLLLIGGRKIHTESMALFRFSEEQIDCQRKRMRGLFSSRTTPLSMNLTVWGSEYINGKLTEIGRLQFEFLNPYGALDKNTVKLHIPSGGKLYPDDVLSAMEAAKHRLPRFYGRMPEEFLCTSWLLSPELGAFCKEGSNIRKFRSLFDIRAGGDCVGDVLHYLFAAGPDCDYTALPEDTSLRKSVKTALIAGQKFNLGIGTITI